MSPAEATSQEVGEVSTSNGSFSFAEVYRKISLGFFKFLTSIFMPQIMEDL